MGPMKCRVAYLMNAGAGPARGGEPGGLVISQLCPADWGSGEAWPLLRTLLCPESGC